MGVDWYTCDKCAENFPDSGPYQICDEPYNHRLCPRCMVDDEPGLDGYIAREACPVCQSMGTERERREDTMERIRNLMGMPQSATFYAIGEAVADMVHRIRSLEK